MTGIFGFVGELFLDSFEVLCNFLVMLLWLFSSTANSSINGVIVKNIEAFELYLHNICHLF